MKTLLTFDMTLLSITKIVNGPLSDKVADTDMELDNVVFVVCFGIITDIKLDLMTIYTLLCLMKKKYTG